MTIPRNLILVSIAGAALLALIALPHAGPVFAHARLASSTPGVGERLTVAPTSIEITFTQEIQKIAGGYDIEVNKDRGSAVTAGPAEVNDADRTKMSVPLQPDLADGRYVVRFKNVSDEDGDPFEGAFSFYLNYEPNAVDLANDADLALIGGEETPAAGDTATAGETVTSDETAVSGETPDATAGAGDPTPAATPVTGGEDDEDDSNSSVLVVILVVVAAVVAGGASYAFARSRRR